MNRTGQGDETMTGDGTGNDGARERLARQVADILGEASVTLETLPPGSSRGAMRVLSAGGQPIAFLRIELGEKADGGASADSRPLAEEIALVRHAHALGFPVPRVFGLLENASVAVMELAGGTARPDAAEAETVGPEYMGHIARLHQISPARFGLPTAATVTEAITEDLDAWVADGRRGGVMGLPVIHLAERILRAYLPQSDAPPAMLHGDVGAGNFMVADGRISAILDWELAHAGDVHEDLAWLWIRGAHTPFGAPEQRIAEYETAAGQRLDPERLAWHVAFVTFKSVVSLQRRMHAPGDDPGLLLIQIAVLTYETLLCAALARILGQRLALLDEVPVEAVDAETQLLRLTEMLAPPATRESEILMAHLRTNAAQRAWRDRRLAEDARALLGVPADELPALIGHAPPERFGALLAVLGAAAGRRCQALPNAERRVRRAFSIGLGQA